MDILYKFDTIGIFYTAVVGGLFLLLFLPAILFAKRRKQTNPGTVFYRVLDIVLIVALAVLWFTYVLCHVELFGLSVKPDGDALAFVNGNTDLFSIPYIGSLYGVFASVLGTVLLGLLSLMAILSLIFSFAFRRKKRAEDAETTAENADDNAEDAADGETVVEAVVFESVEIEPVVGQDCVMTPAFAEAAEAAEDEIVPEKEDDLVAVEVLDEPAQYVPEEFVPVEVLSEEPAREEILTAEIQEDVPPKELSPAVKDAIRTVVLGTPQTVKDALKVVIEEDPFIVREVLRVIVETPAMETQTETVAAEPTESVETSEETAVEVASGIPLPEFPFIAEEESAPIGEPAREADAPTEESAPPASETVVSAIAATTDEIDPEPIAVVSLFAHVSNKTYSSSLRRPDTKKKSVAKEQA